MAAKILILTTEPLPLPGLATTGAGLRAWSLGFGLRSAGLRNVTIAFAADAIRGKQVDLSAVPGIATFERGRLDDFIAEQAPDAVVLQHWPLFSEIRRPLPCPLAIDLAGPHLLERRLWNSANPAGDLAEKLRALAAADFVVCSGAFQRHYFLPFLIQAGHDPRANLCPVIPFSVSPELPQPTPGRDHATFIYGGMFLPWQNPEMILRTTIEVLEEKDRGRLLFIGGAHPGGDVSGGRFDTLMEFLAKSPRVEMLPVMPFDKMLIQLRGAGVALDLMTRNAERELAFPTRTITYMWAGLPTIHNTFDELAEPIERGKAGWTFAEDDREGVAKLVGRLLGHREDVERRSRNAQDLIRASYTWDKTIGPLADWCRDPRVRGGKSAPVIAMPEGPTPEADKPAARKKSAKGHISYSPPRATTDTSGGPWYLSPIVFLLALPVSAALILLFGLAEIARLLLRGKR